MTRDARLRWLYGALPALSDDHLELVDRLVASLVKLQLESRSTTACPSAVPPEFVPAAPSSTPFLTARNLVEAGLAELRDAEPIRSRAHDWPTLAELTEVP